MLDLIAGVERAADLDVSPRDFLGLLDRGVRQIRRHRGPHLRDRDRLRRAEREKIAALEIDPEVLFASKHESGRSRDNQGERAKHGDQALAQEIDVVRGNQLQHRNFLQPAGVHHPVEGIPANNEHGEHRGENAHGERDGETLHRPARLPEQDRRGDQRGDVGIEDRAERLVERGLDRNLERLAERQFLAQAFVNENVRVDRHADRQDDARDARQGEHEVKHGERAHQQDEVHQERDVRDHPGEPVIGADEKEGEGETDQTRDDAGPDGIAPEGGGDAAFLFDAHRRLQRVLEHARQAARLLLAEAAGDDGIAAVDRVPDHGRRLDDAIEDDGEPIPLKLFRDLAERLRAFAVELQLHRPALVAVIGVATRSRGRRPDRLSS